MLYTCTHAVCTRVCFTSVTPRVHACTHSLFCMYVDCRIKDFKVVCILIKMDQDTRAANANGQPEVTHTAMLIISASPSYSPCIPQPLLLSQSVSPQPLSLLPSATSNCNSGVRARHAERAERACKAPACRASKSAVRRISGPPARFARGRLCHDHRHRRLWAVR
jgi:hypothetical protein